MKQPLEVPDEMPTALAIFPLPGVLLLPGAQLPLNIFEPRYLDMVRDAMAGARLIGMVQPRDPHADLRHPEVYPIGCAGQITAFQETDDGRFLITLTGLTRFAIVQEFDALTLYRQGALGVGLRLKAIARVQRGCRLRGRGVRHTRGTSPISGKPGGSGVASDRFRFMSFVLLSPYFKETIEAGQARSIPICIFSGALEERRGA